MGLGMSKPYRATTLLKGFRSVNFNLADAPRAHLHRLVEPTHRPLQRDGAKSRQSMRPSPLRLPECLNLLQRAASRLGHFAVDPDQGNFLDGGNMTAAPLIYIVDYDESMRVSPQRLLGAADYDALAYGSTGEFLLDPLPDRSGCLLLDLLLRGGPSGL